MNHSHPQGLPPATTNKKDEVHRILKSINRHIRTKGLMRGGRTFGVDYVTWNILHPHLARTFSEHATRLTGRPGRYLPRACLQ